MNTHNYNYYFVCFKQNHQYLYTEPFLKNIQKLEECNHRELLGQNIYFVEWSKKDSEFVGTCLEFPSLSWLDSDESKALEGIINLVKEVKFDIIITN